MILKSIHVRSYKSVTDSGLVSIEPEVTCLVGKNESGKTVVLEALYRMNPLPMGHREKFDGLRDYPRRVYVRDRDKVPTTLPIDTIFELSPEDIETIEQRFGRGVIASTSVST